MIEPFMLITSQYTDSYNKDRRTMTVQFGVSYERSVHLFFDWRGGAYIDVGLVNPDSKPPQVKGSAVEVVNVFDYQAGKCRIPNTRKAFREKCLSWLTENCEERGSVDSFLKEIQENWRYR